jgi:peroxiredoxin
MHTEFGSLKAGDAMPQFTVTGADGKAFSLADCAGKTVILSFSFVPTEARMKAAVAAMTRLSAIAARYKDQGVLALNIFTATPRDEFDRWVAGHKEQFAFLSAHDPVGQPAAGASVKSLIISLSGAKMVRLPAALIINAEGKFVGYAYGDNATGDGLAMLLQRSGVKLAPDDLPKTAAAD